MDKLKGVAKGGWHPSGDRSIHRDSWKSDIKGMATGKKKDPYEDARNHQSAPLTTLRDPDSFGAPPRHAAVHGSNPASPSSPARPQPSGGWGSAVPTPSLRQQQQQQEEPVKAPSGPYRADTSGLRTDNLPKPPVRRTTGPTPPATPSRSSAVAAPPPALPSRQPQQRAAAPVPSLPPRMSENPTEYTPPPPPTYNEAIQPSQQDPAALNAGAINRLSQAGVSVPGFGIGNNPSAASTQPAAPQGHTGQLSELQQRFARMNAGGSDQASQAPPAPSAGGSVYAAAAQRKPAPPPPPPKKAGLGNNDGGPTSSNAGGMAPPPPLPMSSKPRPPP